jgi:hypothetical protein
VRFAEVFLRLGASLVAWMMLFAHFLWLAAVYVMECGADGDEMYRLLLGLAPLTCGFALLLRVTRPYVEVHSMLRWLAVPLLLLMPFALRSIWQAFRNVNINSSPLCANTEATAWQQLWAPIQLVTLVFVCYLVVKLWLDSRRDATSAEQKLEQTD